MSGYVYYAEVADRMVLAQLTDDEDAIIAVISDEIGDDACSWQCIAEQLAERVAELQENRLGHDEALAEIQANITSSLDWLAKWAES